MPPGMPTGRRGLARALSLGLILGLGGQAACDREHGQIELNWTLVDRAGTTVAPFGVLADTCDFSGKLAPDAEAASYDLELRLRLCDPDCAAGCDDPACQVEDLRYDCSAARGFSTVPARIDSPYDIVVDLVAAPRDGACGCALTPPLRPRPRPAPSHRRGRPRHRPPGLPARPRPR